MRKDDYIKSLEEDLKAERLHGDALEKEIEEQEKSILKLALRIADLNYDRSELLRDLEDSFKQNEQLIEEKKKYADRLDDFDYEFVQIEEELRSLSKKYSAYTGCGGCCMRHIIDELDILINKHFVRV